MEGSSLAECIHGLEQASCDVCTPKAPPTRPPAARAPRAASTRPARPSPARTPAGSARTRTLARLHVAVRIDELTSALDGALDDLTWSADPPVTGFDSVVLVSATADVAEVVLIAAANEPARDRVRAALAGRAAPRVGVHPPWFVRSG